MVINNAYFDSEEISLYDFQHLLLNRREIEKLLDIDLSKLASDEDQSLNDYAMFPVIPLEEVIGIFLGLNPTELNRNRRNSRYWTIFKAIEKAVRRGDISAEIEQDFDINGNEIQFDIFLSHEVAENWAKTHGLKWNIPPYRKPLEDTEGNNQAIELENQSKSVIDSTELQKEKAKNTQLQAENERLKAELKAQQDRMAELEQKLQQSAVDSEPVLENGKATRISKIQRDIFTLLILKNYQGMESRNALFDVINADLKEQGINNKGASYQTFDNLIDETIRLTKIGLDGKQISHSPFPSKITK